MNWYFKDHFYEAFILQLLLYCIVGKFDESTLFEHLMKSEIIDQPQDY